MPQTENLPQIYARLMKSQGHGHGFYEPENARTLKPGVCGFINGNGQWQIIIDTNNQEALDQGNYTGIDDVVWAPSSETIWEGTTSQGVNTEKISLEAQASGEAVGIPVGASVQFTMDDSVSGGAVFLTNASVIRRGYADDEALRDWAKANAKTILKKYRNNVRRFGFYVVQTTWSAGDTWASAWTDSKKIFSIGCKANVGQFAGMTPKYEYSSVNSGSGWKHPIPTFKNGEVERKVVFFQGLHFRYRFAGLGSSHITESRGDEDSFTITDPEDESVKFEVEFVSTSDDEDDLADMDEE